MPYFLMFIGFFFAEILSLVLFASWAGGAATIMMLALFFFLGVYMLRHIGVSAFLLSMDIFRSRDGSVSWYQMLWPMRYGMAALLFLLPGFFSDIIGLALLLPLKGKAKSAFRQPKKDDNIISGEFSEVKTSQSADTTHHLE
ncbi:MAG: FxsA family protein [Neisseria sp.]|nr:FxsA family protein [Neisseria sp.]